jgi:hypothetical protein
MITTMCVCVSKREREREREREDHILCASIDGHVCECLDGFVRPLLRILSVLRTQEVRGRGEKEENEGKKEEREREEGERERGREGWVRRSRFLGEFVEVS